MNKIKLFAGALTFMTTMAPPIHAYAATASHAELNLSLIHIFPGQIKLVFQRINIHQPGNIQKVFRRMSAENTIFFKLLYFLTVLLIKGMPPD